VTPRRLPSGRWQGVVYLPGSKRRKTATFDLRRDAVAWEQATRTDLRRGVWVDPKHGRTLFEDWLSRWAQARNVEPETAVSDAGMLARHVLPRWSGWPLAAIGRIEVQAWVTGMGRAGTGAATVLKAYGLFAGAMRAAADEDLIARSPCRRIALPEPPAPRLAWWTLEQVEAILGVLAEPHWRCAAALMCWCGMRWEEAAGLAVADVNWLRGEISVHQVVAGRRIKPYPKNGDPGVRTVRMEGPVAELLEPAWRAATTRPAEPLPPGATEPLVWMAADGRPLNYEAWDSYWRDHVRDGTPRRPRPAVPYHAPHVLRHSGASRLVQAGVPLADVGRWLGHGTNSRATAVYAHLCPERSNRTIGEAFAGTTQEPRTATRRSTENPG
jgi:integrase